MTNETATHTPGKWGFGPPDIGTDDDGTGHARGICYMLGFGAQREADARLIAASPSMYAYVATRASSGDTEAQRILAEVHGATSDEGRTLLNGAP